MDGTLLSVADDMFVVLLPVNLWEDSCLVHDSCKTEFLSLSESSESWHSKIFRHTKP